MGGKNNMEKYNAVKRPPADALKTIVGGRLAGMTDISPQWRIQVMTENYGMCGVGWKWEIEKTWTESGSEGQVCIFVIGNLYTKNENEWSEPIPGIGGSKLIIKEKNGLFTNDEAYKMAATDALSTAMKMIGVAADIYRGRWDGSKYLPEPACLPEHGIDQSVKDEILSFKNSEKLKIFYNENKELYKNNQKEFHALVCAQNNKIKIGDENGGI